MPGPVRLLAILVTVGDSEAITTEEHLAPRLVTVVTGGGAMEFSVDLWHGVYLEDKIEGKIKSVMMIG